MDRIIQVFGVTLVLGVIAVAINAILRRSLRRPGVGPIIPYQTLRERILASRPGELVADRDADPCAVLMELGLPEVTMTLVAIADGNASLYFSNGAGVIGAGAHEPVRAAASSFVRLAGTHAPSLARAEATPPPATGRVTFYVVGRPGVLTATADRHDLETGAHALSPLYIAGHRVIAQIRLHDPRSSGGGGDRS